jgi:hypothetical protein
VCCIVCSLERRQEATFIIGLFFFKSYVASYGRARLRT